MPERCGALLPHVPSSAWTLVVNLVREALLRAPWRPPSDLGSQRGVPARGVERAASRLGSVRRPPPRRSRARNRAVSTALRALLLSPCVHAAIAGRGPRPTLRRSERAWPRPACIGQPSVDVGDAAGSLALVRPSPQDFDPERAEAMRFTRGRWCRDRAEEAPRREGRRAGGAGRGRSAARAAKPGGAGVGGRYAGSSTAGRRPSGAPSTVGRTDGRGYEEVVRPWCPSPPLAF